MCQGLIIDRNMHIIYGFTNNWSWRVCEEKESHITNELCGGDRVVRIQKISIARSQVFLSLECSEEMLDTTDQRTYVSQSSKCTQPMSI